MTHPNHTTAGRSHKTRHALLMRAKYALSIEGKTTSLTWPLPFVSSTACHQLPLRCRAALINSEGTSAHV